MANGVHEENLGSHKMGCHRRVYGGLRNRTREELADFWKMWSENAQQKEQAVT